jgi:hypothetical protein
MAKHENPQRVPQTYYPAGHPKHAPRPPSPAEVENAAKAASENPNKAAPAPKEDLGDVIRAIGDMANELHEEFFNIPNLADGTGVVEPEKFDAATRYAFVSCGNALDYAIRLVKEKGSAARIRKLRKELADEMRAAGMSGDPDGESPS